MEKNALKPKTNICEHMKNKSRWFGISSFCFVKIHKFAYVLSSWKKYVFSWTSEPC